MPDHTRDEIETIRDVLAVLINRVNPHGKQKLLSQLLGIDDIKDVNKKIQWIEGDWGI